MAHVGQKFALGLVGLICGLLGGLEILGALSNFLF